MSDLPKGWALASLGQLGEYINGRAFKPTEWKTSGLPIIRIQNLNDSKAKFNYSDKEHEPKFRVKKGDLLVAWSASLGTFIWEGNDAWLNQHIFRVEHFENVVTKEFLHFAIKEAIEELYKKAHGTGMVHVTKPVFESHQIPLPPLNEQKRIVAKLEALLSRVDASKERLEKIPKILKRFRQSVLAAACSGKLTADWRENKEIDLETDLPFGWKLETVGNVIDDLKYGTSQKCDYETKGVPVLRIPNIADFFIDQTDLKFADLPEKEFAQLKLIEGDLLLIRSNGSVSLVGKTSIVRKSDENFAYAGYLIRLRPNTELIFPEFLNFQMASFQVRLQIELPARSTSGVNNINSTEVKALEIALPPLPEQKEIVRRVEDLFKFADSIEERFKQAKAQVDKLTNSILAKAFRGELVPQDEADEPASVLLERIKAEKMQKPARSKGAY